MHQLLIAYRPEQDFGQPLRQLAWHIYRYSKLIKEWMCTWLIHLSPHGLWMACSFPLYEGGTCQD